MRLSLSASVRRLALLLVFAAGVAEAQMTVVNGASFLPGGPFAPGSFAAMFGANLCSQTGTGRFVGPGQLPTELGGCSVTVNGMPAMLHYVSPGQVNFIVPRQLGPGEAEVVFQEGGRQIRGTMMIGPGGPGVFSFNSMGLGLGAMLHGTMWRQGPFSVTTEGVATAVAMFVTGLDLSAEPTVLVGGVPVEVMWFGEVPGYAGLQQINIRLPAAMAGAGMVPVAVRSGGQISNVTFMNILPTTGMMQGMPGWAPGMMVVENMPRGREASDLAFNPVDNTVLISDEDDDALRVISLDSPTTVRTITLPEGSRAHAVAIDPTGQFAAAALSENASVALINLSQPDDIAVIGTGLFPSDLVFAGSNLLVTNTASGTVSVIDTATRTVTNTISVGLGPLGIDAGGGVAVVANLHGASVSVIRLSDFSVNTVPLPPGSRPFRVAVAPAAARAVVTAPMTNGFYLLDLNTNQAQLVETGFWDAMGPGAVAVHNNLAFIANQMTARITVADLSAGSVVTTFPVDPGPRALAVNAARNQLLVLSHATGVLSVVDLNSYGVVARVSAVEGDRQGRWGLPIVASVTPNTAKAGSGPFTLTITGANLEDVEEIEFHFFGGHGPGGGMGGMMGHDPNITVSNLQVAPDGKSLTATVQVLARAVPGLRRIGLDTSRGEVMGGPMFNAFFTVTE